MSLGFKQYHKDQTWVLNNITKAKIQIMGQLWAKYDESQQWAKMGLSFKQYHKDRAWVLNNTTKAKIQIMGQQMTKKNKMGNLGLFWWVTWAFFVGIFGPFLFFFFFFFFLFFFFFFFFFLCGRICKFEGQSSPLFFSQQRHVQVCRTKDKGSPFTWPCSIFFFFFWVFGHMQQENRGTTAPFFSTVPVFSLSFSFEIQYKKMHSTFNMQ
jgi:hypothetical protein